MNFRHTYKSLLKRLPRAIRLPIYRSTFSLPDAPPSELTIRLATTQKDFQDAFSLLHSDYVRQGFMLPHASGMRVTPYHAIPGTQTVIALWNDVVVGTVTIIRDNAFGLPLEAAFDISSLRESPRRVAEISSLAVSDTLPISKQELFLPLFKFVYQLCIRYIGIDYLVLATHPTHADFFDSYFFFEPIENGSTDHYEFVNGAPAVGRYLHLRSAWAKMKQAYSYRPPENNPFLYFTQQTFSNLLFPPQNNFNFMAPAMDPEMLDFFFNRATQIFPELPHRSQTVLSSLYIDDKYRGALPFKSSNLRTLHTRKSKRHALKCVARIQFQPKGESIQSQVRDVSREGFSAFLGRSIRFESEVKVTIEIDGEEIAKLKAIPRWTDQHGTYGFSFVSIPVSWQQFIRELESGAGTAATSKRKSA